MNCDGRKIRLPSDLPDPNYCVSREGGGGSAQYGNQVPIFCHLPIRNPIRTDLWSKPGLWGNRVNAPRSHLFFGRPQIVIMINVSCKLILRPSCHHHTQFYPDSWVLFVRDEDSVSRYLDLERPAPLVTGNMKSWQWRWDLRGNRGAGGPQM